MQNKATLIGWGVVILIGISVATFFGIRSIIRSKTVAPFNQQINTYMGGGVPAANEPNRPPAKVKGKIIPIDVKAREIDYVYFDMPDDIRPIKPEDVGTVALLEWDKVQVGTYSGGSPAYQQTVRVTVVDKDTRGVIGQAEYQGSMPPQRKKSSESGTGSKPEGEVVNFLKTLPR